VFFDHTEPSRTFGVIELKRPDQKIIAKARKRIVRLTTDADIAIKQAQEYGRRFECELLELGARKACFALGNSSHLFVVMGLTDDLAYGMAQDISEMQLRNLVPPGIRFVTYDEVQRCLNNGLPRAIHVLCERSQTQTPVDPAVLPRTRHLRWDGRSRLVYTIPGKPPFSIRQHGTAALPPGISVDATTGVVTIPAQPS
jgi:hypothetical protein